MLERELSMMTSVKLSFVDNLKKYFSLHLAMFKASLISDLEYRANFFTNNNVYFSPHSEQASLENQLCWHESRRDN